MRIESKLTSTPDGNILKEFSKIIAGSRISEAWCKNLVLGLGTKNKLEIF